MTAEVECRSCGSLTGAANPPGLPSEARDLRADCLDAWYRKRHGMKPRS